MSDQLGQFDLGNLLEQAQAMQQRMIEAQEAAAQQVVEGTAGGGAVRVRMTGDLELESVSIDPAVVDPDDVALLEDMVLAAGRDALAQVQELTRRAVQDLDVGLPLPPDP